MSSLSRHRIQGYHSKAGRERGAVLVVALIMLTVLTLLGVTSMTTTSLEEKMAANSQEGTYAFQMAENGLSLAFANADAFDMEGFSSDDLDIANTGAIARYEGEFTGWSAPPPGSLYSAVNFQAAHFDFQSTAVTRSETISIVHGGAYQIAPKL